MIDFIFGMPEGLPVPNESTPPNVFSPWNIYKQDHVGFLFYFSDAYVKMMVACSCSFWRSKIFKTTWRQHLKLQHCTKSGGCVNEMPLCSSVDTTKMIPFFILFCVVTIQFIINVLLIIINIWLQWHTFLNHIHSCCIILFVGLVEFNISSICC